MTRLSRFNRLLGAFLVFIAGMIFCRVMYSGSSRFVFLLWNIFLAWIPLRLSLYLSHKNINANWKAAVVLLAWLLFFPNALFIITDLVHLEVKTSVPVWFDIVLVFTSAIMGLIMAFASLYRVENSFTGNSAVRLPTS